MNKRKIYLPVKLVNDCVGNKELREALTFSLLLKGRFTSSSFNSCNIKDIMAYFKIGHTKAKRLMSSSLKYNLVRKENNQLIANPFLEQKTKKICYIIDVEKLKGWSLKTIENNLRVLRFYQKVDAVEHITSIDKKGKGVHSLKKHKKNMKAKKKMRKGKCLESISFSTISDCLDMSKRSCIKFVKNLEKSGKIKVERSKTEYLGNGRYLNDSEVKSVYGISAFKSCGLVFSRKPNRYELSCYLGKNIKGVYRAALPLRPLAF